MEANYPIAIENQRGASKITANGGILRSKAPSRGLWIPKLVLHKEPARSKQNTLSTELLGTFLDIEVDQSGLISSGRQHDPSGWTDNHIYHCPHSLCDRARRGAGTLLHGLHRNTHLRHSQRQPEVL